MPPVLTSKRVLFASVACALASVLLLPACGADEGRRGNGVPTGPPAPRKDGGPIVIGPACLDGDHKNCSIYLAEHNGVRDCIAGTQYCAGGRWGECVAGVLDGGGYIYLEGGPAADATPTAAP